MRARRRSSAWRRDPALDASELAELKLAVLCSSGNRARSMCRGHAEWHCHYEEEAAAAPERQQLPLDVFRCEGTFLTGSQALV